VVSRRSLLYRRRYGALKKEQRLERILEQHHTAKDKYDQTCSRPIDQSKAVRLAKWGAAQ
jgi:hypothetical protein